MRRSVDQRLRESRPANPFESCKDIDDFRFHLRSDTQVLFSLADIDSKHIDIPKPSQKGIERYITKRNLTTQDSWEEKSKFENERISR